MDYNKKSLELHKKKHGKLEIKSKFPIRNRHDLSIAYTPGVAAVSNELKKHFKKAFEYTIKGNTVAIISDGSAVLGLGNIGPYAALPVMEGKAILFKKFANIDAWPIVLATQNTEEIIDIVKALAPGFGGINLEDIAAPRCFEIEKLLQDIGIPVFHDDQHGAAIVILAALINAVKVVKKRFENLKIVILGAGAAGTATANLLLCLDGVLGERSIPKNVCTRVREIIVVDRQGIISPYDRKMNLYRKALLLHTNSEKIKGGIHTALKGADVLIGVSGPNIVTQKMIRSMAENPIVFALANPVPEIMPDKALQAGAKVVGTGRSDFPNQINNVLAFPGVFRGALDARVARITTDMKVAAVYALANMVRHPSKERILPSIFQNRVADVVAKAVEKAVKIKPRSL
ncbi:MAG TPA: NADP-dependent malic enzyme [Candidatus Nealsonbacteria bacterium]|uniref:Malic enzyme NAD-binding domain-containing protein n=1 Tax=marine sediment metagenome TaxID=412755 RepID=A0A0F9U2Z7_9ZZZZ|nr:NADP-dependent malic enzyme [Candidatus Nealsonbacteria bacterium]HEB46609.1 NADP-dependent malic enzyme [Candidatus Nealsonbacteria bacterium]